MGETDEHIFEGRTAHLGVALGHRQGIAVALAVLLATTTLIAGRGPRHHVATPTVVPSTSPAPTPSPSPTSIGGRLKGIGPFVIFQHVSSDSSFFAIDLGEPGFHEIRLGIPDQTAYEVAPSVQTWGRAVPIDVSVPGASDSGVVATNFWFLSKGGGFDDKPLIVPGELIRSLGSPDGRSVIVVNSVPGDSEHVDIFLASTDGSPPKKIARVNARVARDEAGALSPFVWLPGGGWLALSVCACEATPLRWYTIAPTGSVKPAIWLGSHVSFFPGVSRDGRYVSLYDVPTRDCGQQKICATGPIRILLADTVTHGIRVLARYRNDLLGGQTALSADGSLVAFTLPGSRSIQIINAHNGHVVSTFGVADAFLRPTAFIDNSTILLLGSKESQGGPDSLFLAHAEFGRIRVTEVARDVLFAGWTR